MTFLEFFGAKKEIQIPPSMVNNEDFDQKAIKGKGKSYEIESKSKLKDQQKFTPYLSTENKDIDAIEDSYRN